MPLACHVSTLESCVLNDCCRGRDPSLHSGLKKKAKLKNKNKNKKASPGRSYLTDSPFVEKNGLRLPDGRPSRFAGREPVDNFRQRFAGRLNHLRGEAFHLFQLRTELQQK
jgi:hypothetical protein